MKKKLNVNGVLREFDASEDTPLLWVLRDHMGLTGTKFGCGIMACGACTVMVDGKAMRTCAMPVSALNDQQQITTIEGLPGAATHAVQKAWAENSVAQCCYCQSGMIIAATAMLETNADPSDDEVDQHLSNICRCGTYQLVRVAIKQATKEMRNG
jgi:isoquinoline 1-oxidoreductase alpha subunit